MSTTQRRGKPLPGKTAWRVLGPNGELMHENVYGGRPALLNAQRIAEHAKDEIKLTVERKNLFGQPSPLYRVVRDEDGNIHTTTISWED